MNNDEWLMIVGINKIYFFTIAGGDRIYVRGEDASHNRHLAQPNK